MAELNLYISDVLIRVEYTLGSKPTVIEEVWSRTPLLLDCKFELPTMEKLKITRSFKEKTSINKKASLKISILVLGPVFFSSKINRNHG